MVASVERKNNIFNNHDLNDDNLMILMVVKVFVMTIRLAIAITLVIILIRFLD